MNKLLEFTSCSFYKIPHLFVKMKTFWINMVGIFSLLTIWILGVFFSWFYCHLQTFSKLALFQKFFQKHNNQSACPSMIDPDLVPNCLFAKVTSADDKILYSTDNMNQPFNVSGGLFWKGKAVRFHLYGHFFMAELSIIILYQNAL